MQDHRALMARAVALAAAHHPHPNPRVGALILDSDGDVVGSGAHERAGLAHAEAIALAEAGPRARGGTAVVTLEPCVHVGRTPPCASRLLDAGIARVVIGMVDPDERVSGRGVATLRAAGVEVLAGVGSDLVEALDPGYVHHRRTGRPRVTLKLASTLDGQAAATDGSSRWITSSEARQDAHALRAASDAVMVGAGTALADDPHLGVRLVAHDREQPRPVIVAGARPLPASLQLFARDPLIYASQPLELPCEVVVLGDGHRVDLPAALADLGKRGIVDLLVEGGPILGAALVESGLVDRFVLYLAGSIAGGTGVPVLAGTFATIGDQLPLDIVDVRRVGPDLRVDAVRGE